MMNRYLLFLIGSLMLQTGFAQEFFVKIYHNTDVGRRKEILRVNTQSEAKTETRATFRRMALGVGSLVEEKLYHELEFSHSSTKHPPLDFTAKQNNDPDFESNYYSIHYELSRVITPLDRPLRFMLGLGMTCYQFDEEKLSARDDSLLKERNLGVTVELVPRLSYQLSARFQIELNAKLGWLDARAYSYDLSSNDPLVKSENGSQNTWTLLPAALTGRFGIAYKVK